MRPLSGTLLGLSCRGALAGQHDTLVGHSLCCGTLSCDTLVEPQCCGPLFWRSLVGHSCGALLWHSLVEFSCRTLLWETLVGQSCGTLLWDTLARDSCWKIWYHTPSHTSSLQNERFIRHPSTLQNERVVRDFLRKSKHRAQQAFRTRLLPKREASSKRFHSPSPSKPQLLTRQSQWHSDIRVHQASQPHESLRLPPKTLTTNSTLTPPARTKYCPCHENG